MSLMNVGVSALVTNQQALTTTGHNIANANTAGYSRQTVSQQSAAGQRFGNGYIGKGVQVAQVARQYSELVDKQATAALAASAAASARSQSLVQMQDIYSGGPDGLGASISNMMNAFADVEAAPSDGAARNAVLTRISELSARFRAASSALNEMEYATNQQISNNVDQINSLAAQAASLNASISRAVAAGGQPNDLMDKRDEVIRKINKFVQTSQIKTGDGSINLYVGGSQALVLGQEVGKLSLRDSREYPGSQRLSLYFSQGNGEPIELTSDMVPGGEIGGLLKFNNDDLATGRNLLGRLAMGIGVELNKQNALGLTLSGQPGGDIFALTQQTKGWSNILGYNLDDPGLHATATVVDSRALMASDYQLLFGENHTATLVRLSDKRTFSINDTSRGISVMVDGLRLDVPQGIAANANKGQSILFQPLNKAANEIKPGVHSPGDLAVSSAITANISASNQSTLQLNQLGALDMGGIPQPGVPVALRFNGDGTISYATAQSGGYDWSSASLVRDSDGNALQYQSGQPFTVNGWQIALSGAPAAGDMVYVSNARDLGQGLKLNAGNAQAFLALRDIAMFDGGTTLTDGYSSAMSVMGTRTQSAQYAAELSATLSKNLDADRTSISGVNLDEEAARLLQYQQSYQASSKIIQTAQTLFDSLLQAMH